MLKNLGQIATMLLAFSEESGAQHEDVRAHHAPSECHDLVSAGRRRDAIALVTDIEDATGYSLLELLAEFRVRVSAKWLYQSGVELPLHMVFEIREQDAIDAERNRQSLKQARQSVLPGSWITHEPASLPLGRRAS